VDAFRYLAIIARGWPKNGGDGDEENIAGVTERRQMR
jgi:hypothetical protein